LELYSDLPALLAFADAKSPDPDASPYGQAVQCRRNKALGSFNVSEKLSSTFAFFSMTTCFLSALLLAQLTRPRLRLLAAGLLAHPKRLVLAETQGGFNPWASRGAEFLLAYALTSPSRWPGVVWPETGMMAGANGLFRGFGDHIGHLSGAWISILFLRRAWASLRQEGQAEIPAP